MEHEREVAPVVPAAAGPSPAALAPSPSFALGLSPARVLALQRTAGNRAVSALLARDDKPKTPVTGPGDFGFKGGVPVSSGTTTAAPSGADKVTAKAPNVVMEGEAWLKDGKQLGTAAYLGLIQNLVSSDRAAVYRHGGDPSGDIVSESHDAEKNKWDSAIDPDALAKGEMKAQTFAPFYWKPGSISDLNVEGSPAKVTNLGTAHDQPEFTKPVSSGPGRLTEFKGHDTFKLGMAVKQDATVHMLTGTQWSVNWNMAVDASMNGAGKAVETQAIKDLLKDGPDPSLKDWSLAPGAGSAFEGFSTQAEAMKRTPQELLKWIFAAREHDPTSYKNICAALDAKAPELAVTIHCDTTDGLIGKDELTATVSRGGTAIRNEGVFHLNNGDDYAMKISWADAFGSAGALTPGQSLTVELRFKGAGYPGTIGFPFNGSASIAVKSGKYVAKASLG